MQVEARKVTRIEDVQITLTKEEALNLLSYLGDLKRSQIKETVGNDSYEKMVDLLQGIYNELHEVFTNIPEYQGD